MIARITASFIEVVSFLADDTFIIFAARTVCEKICTYFAFAFAAEVTKLAAFTATKVIHFAHCAVVYVALLAYSIE